MLAVDGQQRGATGTHRRHEPVAADHQGFLVGQQQLLARTRGRHARRQAGRADDGRHHGVHLGRSGHVAHRLRTAEDLGAAAVLLERSAQRGSSGGVGHHRVTRRKAQALLLQQLDLGGGGQREHRKTPGVARHHVQRVLAYRARGPQHGQGLHRRRGSCHSIHVHH